MSTVLSLAVISTRKFSGIHKFIPAFALFGLPMLLRVPGLLALGGGRYWIHFADVNLAYTAPWLDIFPRLGWYLSDILLIAAAFVAVLCILKKGYKLDCKRELIAVFVSYSVLAGTAAVGHYYYNPFILRLQVFRFAGLVMMLSILVVLYSWKKAVMSKGGGYEIGDAGIEVRSERWLKVATFSKRVLPVFSIAILLILGVTAYRIIH